MRLFTSNTKYFKYKKHLKTTLHDWWSLLTSTGWLPDVNKDETSVNIHASNIMVIALDYKTKTQLITGSWYFKANC